MSLSYGDESTIRAYFLVVGMGWVNKTSDRAATLPVIPTLAVDIVKVKGTQKYPFSSYKSPQCVVIVVVVVYI